MAGYRRLIFKHDKEEDVFMIGVLNQVKLMKKPEEPEYNMTSLSKEMAKELYEALDEYLKKELKA